MAKNPQGIKVETIRPRLLSLNYAALYVGIAPKTLRNLLCRGALPFEPSKFGRKILFELRDLDRFADSFEKYRPHTLDRGSKGY